METHEISPGPDCATAGTRESAPASDAATFGFGGLFGVIREAVIVADGEGRVRLWNGAASAIFGYSCEEAAGLNVSDLVPPDLRDRHTEGMARYRATGRGRYVNSHVPLELPALTKDGERIRIEMTLSEIEGPGGDPHALAIIRDVTERARLADELAREEERLRAANRALTDVNDALEAFTYGVSHDLKEPVRAIDAYLQVLDEEHGHALPEGARDYLERARGADRRLAALIDGLLDFSRASRADLAHLTPVNVRDAIEHESCRVRYQHLVAEREGRLEVGSDVPPVCATEPALCQILGNLIVNAIRHNGERAPVVRVSGKRAGAERVEIVVEDNGPGFPVSVLEAFARGSVSPQGASRSGFGLAIARRVVERLGGEMRLGRSEDLGGAAARFTLLAAAETGTDAC